MVLQPIELLRTNIIRYWLRFGIQIEHKPMLMRNFEVFEIWSKKAQVRGEKNQNDLCPIILILSDPSVNCEILHEQTGTPIAQVSPLIIACFEGDADIIRFFIEVSNLDFEYFDLFILKIERMVAIQIKLKVNII